MIGQAVEMGGVVAHTYAVRDELERQVELYLTDEQDQEGIAKPAASIIARHAGGEFGNPDFNDGMAILFAFANYVIKQVAKLKIVAHARAEIAAGTPPEFAPEDRAA